MDLPCVSGDVCGNAYVSPCGRVPPKVNYQIKENIYWGDQRTNIWGEMFVPHYGFWRKIIEREGENPYGNLITIE